MPELGDDNNRIGQHNHDPSKQGQEQQQCSVAHWLGAAAPTATAAGMSPETF